jgi:hypothetical protein
MPSTYESIATYTVPSDAANYTFSSIPSTFTDIILVVTGNNGTGGNRALYARFNGDAGTNYSTTKMQGTGSVASDRAANVNQAQLGNFLNNTTLSINHLQNYSNTSINKMIAFRCNAASTVVQTGVCLWRSNSAISSIFLFLNDGNFVTGTTFTLYGIKAA